MCGITGYMGNGTKEILEKMTDSLKYRGPDSVGYYCEKNIGLGHRRLSIIDLDKRASQPMTNEDGSIIVVFNGEIYNFKSLRQELEKKNHVFRTKADTEIILHSYEEKGEKCAESFNGMFAFAIWDKPRQKLLLARDRFGKKPLYYFFDGKNLVFASEIKALLLHPATKRDLDNLSLWQYFAFDYVPQPRTIFKQINKLESGQILVCEKGKIELKYYYQLESTPVEILESEAINNLDVLLADSVGLRLVADVPLGVFLSGGIDSSTIAYYAKQIKPDLQTFSVGFEEQSFDETVYAKQAAVHLKTDHYHQQFSEKKILEVISKIFTKLDEPFGDSSILPTYLLSEFVGKQVKVALSGDGGDELFYGYPNHKVQKLSANLLFRIKPSKEIIDILIECLPFSEKNMSFSFKAQRALYASQFSGLYRDFIVIGGFNNQFDKLFDFQIKKSDIFFFIDKFLNFHLKNSYLEKAGLLLQKYYLSDDILFKTDRASMYNSIEVRAPFLDYRIADFLNNLPTKLKLRGFNQSKYILKKLMTGKLPERIIQRKKKGFGVPMAKWLRNELKSLMLDSLSKKNIEMVGFLNYSTVEKLIDQHFRGRKNNQKILWNLVCFVNVFKNYISL